MADSPPEKTSRGDETGSADEKIRSTNVENATRQRAQVPEFILSLTPEEREVLEKKLKRKIDLRLLPAVIIMYIMNYIDRCVGLFVPCAVPWLTAGWISNNIAAARLAGLERDLNLTSTEFQTAVSILFVG